MPIYKDFLGGQGIKFISCIAYNPIFQGGGRGIKSTKP